MTSLGILPGSSLFLLLDPLADGVALERLYQNPDRLIVLMSLLDSKNVDVGRVGALNKKSVLACVQSGRNSIVAVDDGSVNIGQNAGNRSSLNFGELQSLRIGSDVERRSRNACAVLERNKSGRLEQKQGASLVRRVIGNADLCSVPCSALNESM